MGGEFGACQQSVGRAFEIDIRKELLIVGGGLAARICHGEKSDFVALRSHQVHQLEHIHLSAAERKIVFVAV
jgi:hypothetical protein